jgi:hypothetical protein
MLLSDKQRGVVSVYDSWVPSRKREVLEKTPSYKCASLSHFVSILTRALRVKPRHLLLSKHSFPFHLSSHALFDDPDDHTFLVSFWSYTSRFPLANRSAMLPLSLSTVNTSEVEYHFYSRKTT